MRIALCLLLTVSCGEEAPEIPDAVLNQPIELRIDRFDTAFDGMTPEGLPALKARYPYLFPEQFPDSVWLAKHADTLQTRLRAEVAERFADFGPYSRDLELLFKHVRYYFPDAPVPRVVLLTNDVDYANRVVLADTLLLLSLDNYLGPGHPFYANIDRYIARGLDSGLLVSDVASAVASQLVPPPADRSFIARMVYYGKILYLKDRLLPLEPDGGLIGYTGEEIAWARENENQIWRYFVERELLYSTDRELGPRFLDPAPFSKFRLELIDNESPARIGRYLGWQIVRAFMESHPEVELHQMLALPGDRLFRDSAYKPPR